MNKQKVIRYAQLVPEGGVLVEVTSRYYPGERTLRKYVNGKLRSILIGDVAEQRFNSDNQIS